MEFSSFAQSLYPFYDWSKDKDVGSDKRKIGKGPFAKILLKAGLDAEGVNIIEDLKNDTFLKYFEGTRPVTRVMQLTNSHFDEEFFNDSIYEMFEWKFNEIRDAFNEKFKVKIKPGNEAGSLVKVYLDIRNVPKKTKEPKEPISAPAQQKMLPKDQDAIAEIIMQLGSILKELKYKSCEYHLADNEKQADQIHGCTVDGIKDGSKLSVISKRGTSTEIDQVFGCPADPESPYRLPVTLENGPVFSPFLEKLLEFRIANDRLLPYIERYPKYAMLNYLHSMGERITSKWLLYRPADLNTEKTYHSYIDHYEKHLKECNKDIRNPTFLDEMPCDEKN